jgi:hypothetical protein
MPGPFESYNARFVDPRTVAETFVLREREFTLLCEQNNSLLVGPRGSGKTTLLKMLKVGAQIKWKTQRQSKVLRRFSFTPIYVGADRQFEIATSGIAPNPQFKPILELIAKGLLSFRVKVACLEAAREISDSTLREVESLSHQYVSLTSSHEARICGALSTTWDLNEKAVSFLEVRAQLLSQVGELNRIIDRIKFGAAMSPEELLIQRQFFSHDPIYACQAFVDAFNEAIEQPQKTWALCVDELEIMPENIQSYLFSCLRSIDQRIILKIATSPFSAISWDRSIVARPMAGHDFTAINLSFARKNDARRFSAQLFDAVLAEAFGNGQQNRTHVRGVEVLGRSPISEANSGPQQKQAYRPPNGDHYRRFKALQEVDVAFRQFLEDRNIDIERVYIEEENKRAGQARKYIWQVAVRLEYGPNNYFRRKDNRLAGRSPSRKAVPSIYLGFDSLMTICEGNPRTIIGLLRPVARRFAGERKVVSAEIQGELLRMAIAKYFSLLSTITIEDELGNATERSVIDLLDDIGEFCSEEVNGGTFKSEPSLTIRMDKNVSRPHLRAIGNAMNQGAFVMLADEIGLFDFGSLAGARLRLSYLLCPRYHMPLIVGQSINLSGIISAKSPNRNVAPVTIRDLFEDGGEDASI